MIVSTDSAVKSSPEGKQFSKNINLEQISWKSDKQISMTLILGIYSPLTTFLWDCHTIRESVIAAMVLKSADCDQ